MAIEDLKLSAILSIKDDPPPDDWDYDCVIVFDDGGESLSNGGTVCQCTTAQGWRRILK